MECSRLVVVQPDKDILYQVKEFCDCMGESIRTMKKTHDLDHLNRTAIRIHEGQVRASRLIQLGENEFMAISRCFSCMVEERIWSQAVICTSAEERSNQEGEAHVTLDGARSHTHTWTLC